jgi:hypothetical protein
MGVTPVARSDEAHQGRPGFTSDRYHTNSGSRHNHAGVSEEHQPATTICGRRGYAGLLYGSAARHISLPRIASSLSKDVRRETDTDLLGAPERRRARSRESPATSRRRYSGKDVFTRAWRRTPTVPAPFFSPSPDKPDRFRKRVSSLPRPADPVASQRTRSRAASSSPAPRSSGCATGWD